MTTRLRLAVVLCALLPAALGLARWSAGAADGKQLSEFDLPRTFGPWQMIENRRLDSAVFQALRPDTYFFRLYEAPGKAPIWLYLSIYAGRAGYGRGAHDPAVCYPAQGWDVFEADNVTLTLSDAHSLVATRLITDNGVASQTVLYWFQPAGRWPGRPLFEQLLRVYDAAMGRPQYVFARLSTLNGEGFDEDRDLKEFARLLALPLRNALEAGRVGD